MAARPGLQEAQGDALVAAIHARMQNHPRFVDFLPPDLWPPRTAIEGGGHGSLWLREGGPDRVDELGVQYLRLYRSPS